MIILEVKDGNTGVNVDNGALLNYNAVGKKNGRLCGFGLTVDTALNLNATAGTLIVQGIRFQVRNAETITSKLASYQPIDSTAIQCINLIISYDSKERTTSFTFGCEPADTAHENPSVEEDVSGTIYYRLATFKKKDGTISDFLDCVENIDTTSADNVKSLINGTPIDNILESDGVTAKQATKATSADNDGNGANIANTYATKTSLSGYVLKSGDTMTGKLTVPQVETGTATTSYFQTQRFRGQGDASTYYHAIDFGYANHDRVDFYEYGGIWNFWKNTSSTATSDASNRVASLQLGKLLERGNTLTYPNKSGTFALTDDLANYATATDFNALKTSVTTNTNDITVMKNVTTQNTEDITACILSIKSLNTNYDSLKATVDTHTTSINSNSTNIDYIVNGTTVVPKAKNATTADSATKATQDGAGNVITDTYAAKASLAKVATSGSYNDLSDKPTIPTVPTNIVKYTAYTNVSVAGTTKNTNSVSPDTIYVANGLIMGGTAAAAGLCTRGICGIKVPDNKGGCTKENLYLNYDGDNDTSYSRKVVLGAGSIGSSIYGGAYSYCAVRGDEMTSYVTNLLTNYAKSTDLSNYVDLTSDQTVAGVKTYSAPANISGTEQATAIFNTANGGQMILGKEGNNSGTMFRFDQVAGTCRLRFRASATAGAIVWEQPESGSCLYLDVYTVQFRKSSSIQLNNFTNATYLYTDSNGYVKKGTGTLKKSGDSTNSAKTGITATSSQPSFTGTSHNHSVVDDGHSHAVAKLSVTYDAASYTLSFDESSAYTSSASTGISLSLVTAGGSVSTPTITITDNGHTHTM